MQDLLSRLVIENGISVHQNLSLDVDNRKQIKVLKIYHVAIV